MNYVRGQQAQSMEAALNKHLERVAAAYQPRDSTTVARGDDDLLLQPDAANPNGPLIVEVEMRINGGEAYLLPALLRRVVAQRSAVLGPNHKETLFAANTLGTMLLHLGALPLGRRGSDGHTRTQARGHAVLSVQLGATARPPICGPAPRGGAAV